MHQSTIHSQLSVAMSGDQNHVLDADGIIDWLRMTPGDKLVATRTNIDTGVLAGLRMRLDQDLTARQISIALDAYRMAPDAGASTAKLLRLTLGRRGSAETMSVRKCLWRGRVVDLDPAKLEDLLGEMARISQSLRRSYLPPIKSVDELLTETAG